MGENSKIEWTHHTFNLVIGCAKVSPACLNCYAEAQAGFRFGVKWGKDEERKIMSEGYWKKPLTWNRQAEKAGQPQRVFCSSLADVFEDHHTVNQQRERLWSLIQQTPWLDWLLLTKRPQNIERFLPVDWNGGYDNVWMGTTVEDQQRADERLPVFLDIPAHIKFLSCEPLLSSVDLNKKYGAWEPSQQLDWVIVGGESGKGARPTKQEWVEEIHDWASGWDIAFFFKQWGNFRPCMEHLFASDVVSPLELSTENVKRLNGSIHYIEMGKKEAGREYLGTTWNEFPETMPRK